MEIERSSGGSGGPSGAGSLRRVQVTKALAAASAYDANDVMSETATAGSGTMWTFANVANAIGAKGYITKAEVQSESENVTPRVTLYLFNAASTTAEFDDHAANNSPDAADKAKFVGKIDFPAMESLGTTDSYAVCTPSTTGGLPIAFQTGAANALYGIAVTRDAFTQTATDDLTLTITTES